MRSDNARLATQIAAATERAEKSQRQFEALYDAVGTLNSNFSGLQSNFISRDEVVAKVKSAISLIDAVNVRCDELSEKKMDANSTALENKVKEIAYETSSRHISTRDREQREWFSMHMGESESKLTALILTTQRDTRGHVENEVDGLRRVTTDAQAAVAALQRELDQQVQVLVGVDKAFVAKLESHERALGDVETGAQHEVDALRRLVKSLLVAVGVDSTRLSALTNDAEILDDADDARRAFQRRVAAARRDHEGAKAWRVVRALHPGVAAALSVEPADDGPLDLRPLEVQRDDRLRIAEHRARALAERLANVDATLPLSAGGKAILAGPLFMALREAAMEQCRLALQTGHKELAADFGTQMQGLQRELRSKVGSQRVVELIEQYAAQMVKAESDKFSGEIARISQGMMHREDILTALTGKADARALIYKADMASVASSFDRLEARIADASDAVADKLSHALEAKARELHSSKLDKRDPTYTHIVTLVQSGAAFNPPALGATASAAAAGGRCVSCGVAPTASDDPSFRSSTVVADASRPHTADESHAAGPGSGRSAGGAHTVSGPLGPAPLQSASPVRSAPHQRPGSADVRVATAGSAGDWVQLMDTKFKARVLVPAPPGVGGTTGSGTKPPLPGK